MKYLLIYKELFKRCKIPLYIFISTVLYLNHYIFLFLFLALLSYELVSLAFDFIVKNNELKIKKMETERTFTEAKILHEKESKRKSYKK